MLGHRKPGRARSWDAYSASCNYLVETSLMSIIILLGDTYREEHTKSAGDNTEIYSEKCNTC